MRLRDWLKNQTIWKLFGRRCELGRWPLQRAWKGLKSFLACIFRTTGRFSWCNTLRRRQKNNKIAAISVTTFSNVFSWMKMYEFCLRFHQSLFLRFELTIFQHWFRWWLGADQATGHYLNQWWLDYLHIYGSLGHMKALRCALAWSFYPWTTTVD